MTARFRRTVQQTYGPGVVRHARQSRSAVDDSRPIALGRSSISGALAPVKHTDCCHIAGGRNSHAANVFHLFLLFSNIFHSFLGGALPKERWAPRRLRQDPSGADYPFDDNLLAHSGPSWIRSASVRSWPVFKLSDKNPKCPLPQHITAAPESGSPANRGSEVAYPMNGTDYEFSRAIR